MTERQGWTPDKYDPRDFTLDNPKIQNLLAKMFNSQATAKLAEILGQIVQALEQIGALKVILNEFPDRDTILKEIKEIASLNVSGSKTPLNLVPANLIAIETDKGDTCDPPIGTRLKVLSDPTYDPSEPSAHPNCLYVPILGNSQDCQNKELALPRTVNLISAKDAGKIRLEDLRIEDQGDFQSCTAHAAVALMEYFELKFNRQCSKSEETQTLQPAFSSRFLYKVTRTLYHRSLQKEGRKIENSDSGAPLRDTLKAMLLFGVPPEDSWTWDIDQLEFEFDQEPPAFCYAYAKNYQAVKFFRLDRLGMDPKTLLAQIKVALVAQFPVIFGFRIFEDDLRRGMAKTTGVISFPPKGYPADQDQQPSGHAVMAIGYDDNKDTGNGRKGALCFKNCWGKTWGENGYGWLPYEYVLEATAENYLTRDWWTLIDANWADTENFVGATFDRTKSIQFAQETNRVWVLGDEGSPFD